MKILLLSDLHLEFAKFEPDPWAVAAADVIVLAGDIAEGLRGTRWGAKAFPPTKPIVYVAGNHEFYGHDLTLMRDLLRQDCRGSNIHFLDNSETVINGIRFLGSTFWTDFKLLENAEEGQLDQARAMVAGQKGLVDYQAILNAGRFVSPHDILREHEASRKWLAERLAAPFAGPTVVVTHHAPSALSGDPKYRGDELSPCFASELPDDFFGKARLWLHGHMHNSSAYELGGTMVACHPRGYPRSRVRGPRAGFENPEFEPAGKLIELEVS